MICTKCEEHMESYGEEELPCGHFICSNCLQKNEGVESK